MATPAQKAFADALRALAGIIEGGEAAVEAAAPAAPKPAKPPKAAPAVNATPVAEVPAAPAPAKKEEPKAAASPAQVAATNGAPDLMADARKAAKAYAGTFGREGLKEILTKYTEGTLADVPPEKLPELLKELS